MQIKIHYYLIILIMAFAVIIPVDLSAQDNKPKLAKIILTEERSDPQAVEIVENFYADWISQQSGNVQLGEVRARFLPLHKEGSNDRFVFAILYNEPLGGCFSRGCYTIILHSRSPQSEWEGVFRAFVHNSYYDINSRDRGAANLIFTSNLNNKNPGVWMWNGLGYRLVND